MSTFGKKEIVWLAGIAALFVMFGCTLLPMTAKAAAVEKEHFTFDNIHGGKSSTYSPDYRVTITVFGRPGCFNTRSVLQNIVSAGLDREAGIQVLYVDIDQNSKSMVAELAAQYDGADIDFCYDTTSAASKAMWSYVNSYGSITLPCVVFVDNEARVITKTSGYCSAETLVRLAHSEVVNDDTLDNLAGKEELSFSVVGDENYDYAFSVLSQLNSLRRSLGLSPLTMDEELLSVAMQRAAEIGIYYDHERPNGDHFYTLCSDRYTFSRLGENIAIGYTSASDVMTGWTNSQGHYENMTTPNFSSVGIGCFKTSNGTYCWVQFFSSLEAKAVSKSGTQAATHSITADVEKLNLTLTAQEDVQTLSARQTFTMRVENSNTQFPSAVQSIDPENFTFFSSHTAAATISERGVCTMKQVGHTTITATLKRDSRVSFSYKCHLGHFQSADCKQQDGWVSDGIHWYYYQNGIRLKNQWKKDSVGWCYLGFDGEMKTNAWVKDSVGWCYVDGSGYIVKSNWVNDGGKWYYLNAEGYMLSNTWQRDSTGWCYLGADGAMKTNAWIKDSFGWCYVGADGYCITNNWVKDSVGWVYLDGEGRMLTNAWVKDSVGWCYVGADGYAVTKAWKKDRVGWCYLNANGNMTKSDWVCDNGSWYYLDANGYMVTGSRRINGRTYTFNSNGVWIE